MEEQMKIQCQECKGTGLNSFVHNAEDEDDFDFIPIYDFEVCENCQGQGFWEIYEYE